LNAKFTKKAIQLAQQKGIDITKIDSEKIITENDIINMINKEDSIGNESNDIIMNPGDAPRSLNRVIVLGGGFGAMQVIDILLNNHNNQIVGILDDNIKLKNTEIFGIKIIGKTDTLKKLWKDKAFDKAIISISTNIPFRKELYSKSKKLNIPFINAICPTVRINRYSTIGEGNVICSQSHIGTCSSIGNNNFISSQANIEHHNVWGSHITTGPNCSTSSRVKIGDSVKFGMGIFIQPGISIGDNCLISSGSIITKSINSGQAVKTKLSSDIKPIKK